MHFRNISFRFFLPKIASKIAFFHTKNQNINSSDFWFIKIVCTLCFRYEKEPFSVFISNYLHNNLTHLIAFNIVEKLSTFYCSPNLAYSFFQYTKLDLNIIYSNNNYNALMKLFCQLGNQNLAKLIFNDAKDTFLDNFFIEKSDLGFFVNSFSNAGLFDEAKKVLFEGEKCNVEIRAYVYNTYLNLLMKRNRVGEGVNFFENHVLKLKCYVIDTCTFNIVIQGLCRIGEVEKASSFFNDMKSFGILHDIWTYNTMINGFCRAGLEDKGFELLREVQSKGVFLPDTVTYTSVISGYCKSGNMKKAKLIFDEMSSFGVKPSLFTFNVLIDGFGKNDDMNSALNMYQKMASFGCFPDVVTFSSLIDGYCRGGYVDQGLRLREDMNSRNVNANLYTFSILINALCKQNRISEARGLLSEMRLRRDIFPQPFVYNPVIDGFCKAGNVDEANVIVEEMQAKKCYPDKLTFTILIIGHCMKGRMVEAMNIFDKMLALGCTPDKITINNLVSRLLKAGMPNEAFRIKKIVFEDVNSRMPSSRRDVPLRTNVETLVAA